MIQGGIQGDEDAGFITSQILTRTRVHTGNLLIVPRADVPSIHIHKRQFNVDLNRRFDRDYDRYFEDRLARVIRFLIGKCDGFIHLHEGSGFHTPQRIDDLHGPHRYGQSVIIDTDVYEDRIFLAEMVEKVLKRVNADVRPQKFSFRLFNTHTFSSQTAFPEQQKSLSFYAVKQLNIPALAIEVSKNIHDLPWKVQHQMKVVGGFLEEFGISCTLPVVHAQEITNWYSFPVPLLVNGQSITKGPVVLKAHTPFLVSLDTKNPESADREYGLFVANRPGYNLLDRNYLPLHPFERFSLVMDGKQVAEIPVKWTGTWPKVQKNNNPIWVYSVNDTISYAPSGSKVDIHEGDQVIIEGIWQGQHDEVLNIKGFVSNTLVNTGQDTGVPVLANKGNFFSRYTTTSDKDNSWEFRVQRETQGVARSVLGFRVLPKSIKALEFRDENASGMVIPASRERLTVAPGMYSLSDVWVQGNQSKPLVLVDEWPVTETPLTWKGGESHTISLYGSRDFKPLHSIVVDVVSPAVKFQPVACAH